MRILIALILGAACGMAADVKLGKPLTLPEATPIAKINAKPAEYAGKIVQVKGKVTEVCTMMGCWMNLVDAKGQSAHIEVEDGDIVFPKTAIGKQAIAEGKVIEKKLTKEQAISHAKHEERGVKFNPASVKGAMTLYEIEATGAVVLDR
ncbi:MAG: DUF4920 domain-containing protein [Bryobacteraceae bacterium]